MSVHGALFIAGAIGASLFIAGGTAFLFGHRLLGVGLLLIGLLVTFGGVPFAEWWRGWL